MYFQEVIEDDSASDVHVAALVSTTLNCFAKVEAFQLFGGKPCKSYKLSPFILPHHYVLISAKNENLDAKN